jgi:2-polyprenyl-3-methyl-5-hydroxy-6-metoxy-1,4-benzoquinol methylase
MKEQSLKASREIEHGRKLAEGGAENMWGWGTPAGAERAHRRGRLISEAAGLTPGIRALELGCGSGLFTRMFAETGAEVTANDISPELIEIAQKQNPGTKFICARFEDLPGGEQFDAIVGSSVLHHLDLDAALSKCRELLKPGGRMSFAEPNLLNPQVFAERTFLRKRLGYVSQDETAFVRWQLARKLKAFGFEQIKIIPFDWLHPAVPSTLIAAVQAAGKLLEKIPAMREFSGSLLISCRKA